MKLIAQLYHPEVAMLPIGGYYTMGPKEAALAVELLQPKMVLPSIRLSNASCCSASFSGALDV